MQQQQRKMLTTAAGGGLASLPATAATITKRTRARNNNNNAKQLPNTIATTTPTKQKTFTTFKFNSSMLTGRLTECTTANAGLQQKCKEQDLQILELVDSDDAKYEDDYTSSSSIFSSSSHQHSLDYEAEDEYEDKKKSYENKSLLHVQNFLKCFDGTTKKPPVRTVTMTTTTTTAATTSSHISSSPIAPISYINSSLTAASAAEAELINSLTTFKSGLKASNYVSSDVTTNSCVNSVMPMQGTNSSLQTAIGNLSSAITSISSSTALNNVNSVTLSNASNNINRIDSVNVTDLTLKQNLIAPQIKSTTSLELRNYRVNYKNTPNITNTLTATTTTAASATTAKLQKFQISTKFLRKPRNKLKILPSAGQTTLQLQQQQTQQAKEEEQEQQQQEMLTGLATQFFTDDSNAKFKDFSIDSLLNK